MIKQSGSIMKIAMKVCHFSDFLEAWSDKCICFQCFADSAILESGKVSAYGLWNISRAVGLAPMNTHSDVAVTENCYK